MSVPIMVLSTVNIILHVHNQALHIRLHSACRYRHCFTQQLAWVLRSVMAHILVSILLFYTQCPFTQSINCTTQSINYTQKAPESGPRSKSILIQISDASTFLPCQIELS